MDSEGLVIIPLLLENIGYLTHGHGMGSLILFFFKTDLQIPLRFQVFFQGYFHTE